MLKNQDMTGRSLPPNVLLGFLAIALVSFHRSLRLWSSGSLTVSNDIHSMAVLTLNETTPAQDQQRTDANGTSSRIATFLLAGAQKAGTTATADYLFRRSDICGPKPRPGISYTRKEAHFFDEEDMMDKGLKRYEGLFSQCPEGRSTILMDATPKYMLYPENIRKIYEEHGTADSLKIMFTLREPAQRELSWYSHLLREARSRRPASWAKEVLNTTTGKELTFSEYVNTAILPSMEEDDPSNRGLYAHWLSKWFRLFDRRQIFIASYHDLRRNETDFFMRLHEFLELPEGHPTRKAPRSNGKRPIQDPIPCEVQQALAAHYEQHNEELYALLASNPGPSMEQTPFRRFQFQCRN